MWWHVKNLSERVKHRNTLKNCNRCGLLYKKQLVECPRCSGLEDSDLDLLLQRRVRARVGMGRVMLYASIAIIIAIIVLNGIF